jgi:hypothetical protein
MPGADSGRAGFHMRKYYGFSSYQTHMYTMGFTEFVSGR